MSLILTQPALLGDIKVLAQGPPELPEVMPLLDELRRRRPEAGEDMGPRNPRAEGVAELPSDQPVEFCATHDHHANRAPRQPGRRTSPCARGGPATTT